MRRRKWERKIAGIMNSKGWEYKNKRRSKGKEAMIGYV